MFPIVSLAQLNVPYQSGSSATSRAFLTGHREVVVSYTKALSEAIKLFKRDRAAAVGAMAAHTGNTDREELEDSWRLFVGSMPDVPALCLPGLRFVMDNVIEHPAARQRSLEEFVDLTVVRALVDEGFYAALWS